MADAQLTDEEWALWKTAILEYSMYRPYLVYAAFEPVPNNITQVPPDGAFSVESIDYGEQLTLTEVMTSAGDQGWCFANGALYLTPAPTDTTPINIVWRIAHQPDELTRTFPTVPAKDMYIVEWLVEAVTAEAEATPVEMGLSGYTIGGTTVRWAQSGGSGAPSTATRAERLRNRAIGALSEPLSAWG